MINLVKKIRPFLVFLIIPIIIPLSIFLIYSEYFSSQNPSLVIDGFTMGTSYQIVIYSSENIDKKQLKSSIDSLLIEINTKMSTYDDNSELSIINKNNSIVPIQISEDLAYVIEKGQYYSKITNGLYDITILPLVELWGFGKNKNHHKNIKPNDKSIKIAKNKVGYDRFYLKNNYIHKKVNELKIDLSSIAKGYAVDKVSDLLIKEGYVNHLVEIGGEIKAHGSKNGEKWSVAIKNPLSTGGLVFIKINNLSVATSGTYNNKKTYSNEQINYSHIINPKTGYPIRNNIISATILSDLCVDADALATSVMNLNPKRAMYLIDSLGFEGLIISINDKDSLEQIKTAGFNKYLGN